MKKVLLLLTPFLFGSALAETYVPNTKVSYRLVNSSHVYLDAEKGEDFVEFYCTKGAPVFYLNLADPVMTQAEFDADKSPALTYQVDSQPAKTLPTVVIEEDSEDNSHLSTLAVDDKNDPAIFAAFKGATTKVVLQLTRTDKTKISLTFPTKGLDQALKAINNCK